MTDNKKILNEIARLETAIKKMDGIKSEYLKKISDLKKEADKAPKKNVTQLYEYIKENPNVSGKELRIQFPDFHLSGQLNSLTISGRVIRTGVPHRYQYTVKE